MNSSFRIGAFTLALALLLGSGASCSKILYAPQYQTGTVTHVVICYLKNPGNAADRQKIMDAARELRKIPGIYDSEVGPVLKSERPIVVSDYDLAMVMTFRDVKSMEAYVNHPIHQKAAKEVLQPLTSKVVVYDFVNQE